MKKHIANILSIIRIFVAYIALGLLFVKTSEAYIAAFILTILAIALDGLDGYVARKLNISSKLGSVLDIMGDRIVEVSYWITFAVLGWLNILFPLVCVARAFVTDTIRGIALTQGMTAFGENSMQSSPIGKFICASRFMRGAYGTAKVLAFVLLILGKVPALSANVAHGIFFSGVVFAWIAIIFCVVRALPVIAESGKLFENQDA